MGIEGVIFDMDGVLLFSNEIHVSAYHKTFSDFGLKGFDHASISGMRTDEVMKIMLHKNDMPTRTSIAESVREPPPPSPPPPVFFAIGALDA